MIQQDTHITLMNKKDRFEYHLGDLMIIGVLFVISVLTLNSFGDFAKRYDVFTLVYCIIYFAYFLFFESVFGKSPLKEKYAKVVDAKGDKPAFWRILIRTLVRFLPFDSLSFLILKRGRGLHDVLSGTEVVIKFKKN